MKGKSCKTFLSVLTAAVMITSSGCSILDMSSSNRPDRERSGSVGSEVLNVASIGDEAISGDSLYVTGVEDKIALRETDEDNSKVLAQLEIGTEVKLISEDSMECIYVSYEEKNIQGYVKKNYLTDEKSAVCKRQDAYISKNTSLYDSKDSDHSEILTLNKNSGIFIVSKNSGDYWYVYSKASKEFGFVKSMDISSSKIQDKSSAASSQTQAKTTTPAPTTQSSSELTIGSGSVPNMYTTYYAKVNTGYLAIRSAKTYSDSNIIGKIYSGEAVYVILTSTDSKYWYCYSPTNGVYGYVDSNYLVTSKPSVSSSASSDYSVWTVGGTTYYLALRSAPTYDGNNEIGRLTNGQKVYVYSNSYANYTDKYWYVYSPSLGKWGYVDSNYIWS